MVKYPTEWAYGIPRGSISDRKTSLMLVLKTTTGKGKKFNKSYAIDNFPSKEECMKFVEEERIRKSRELGLTRNEIRFLDRETIEVQLTQEKTFITDAKHIAIINQYPLQAKAKKEEGKTRYYVLAQDKKRTFQFTKLITNYKIVDYINGNTLDLREINMKEFGFEHIVSFDDDIEKIDNITTIEDISKYYVMSIDSLPHNKWILGSAPGSVFFRKNDKNKILTMRLYDVDGKKRSKTFKISDYGSVREAKIEARKYLVNVSHTLGVIKNRIRILDFNIIEIMLDEDHIMKTDYVFLPLFIPLINKFKSILSISRTYSGSDKKNYCVVYNRLNKSLITFHKFIMGSNMIDHINGDPLDNRLQNLRFTNYSHNNTNRSQKNKDTHTGVILKKEGSYCYYRAAIKDHSHYYSKMFPLNKYKNKKAAKKAAIKFRKNILEINFYMEEDFSDINFTPKDISTIQNSIKRTTEYQADLLQRIILLPDDYLFGYNAIDPELKNKMHKKYVLLQAYRYFLLSKRIKILKDLI